MTSARNATAQAAKWNARRSPTRFTASRFAPHPVIYVIYKGSAPHRNVNVSFTTSGFAPRPIFYKGLAAHRKVDVHFTISRFVQRPIFYEGAAAYRKVD